MAACSAPVKSIGRFLFPMDTLPRRIIIVLALLVSVLPGWAAAETSLGQFDDHTDIGAPKIAGSASFDTARQEYTMTAGGTNIWATRDEFQFLWKKLKGDFILRARVEFVGKGTEANRKLGWMARGSLDADAPYADAAEHGSGLTSLQTRAAQGAQTTQVVLTVTNSDVIQLERKGNTYVFSAARFGETFTSAELKDLALGDEVYAGLFLCAHNADVKEQAVFRDVQIIKPVKVGFRPYSDFIGSVLHTLDVTTFQLDTLYRNPVPFEAPNWTTDGKALIYNVSGRAAGWGSLQRFDLATRTPSPIDLGPAKERNNNDHVLSFDGTMLGISHQGAASPRPGQSAVFTVPTTGGAPKLITKNTPSYFHGWSPDGKWLVFAGGRKDPPGSTGTDKYDIYKIAADGSGEEIRLTSAKGRSDGPEFTPDGRWIYFNSTRATDPTVADPKHLMQIWRMKPDGSGQEQVTQDDFNNWFPHISPDGKWIAYISFPSDLSPEDHPYYRHCYLRLMPVGGGPSKVIAYVYGGQGTINVPSWSPDSKKIAFVSNTDLN